MQIDRCAYAVVEEDNDELGAIGDAGVRGRVAEVFRRPNPRQTPGFTTTDVLCIHEEYGESLI